MPQNHSIFKSTQPIPGHLPQGHQSLFRQTSQTIQRPFGRNQPPYAFVASTGEFHTAFQVRNTSLNFNLFT
jgi:hypothetical protein